VADPNEQKQDEGKPEIDPATKERRRYIIIGVVALIVVVSLVFYWRSTYSETTDDAQVDGNLYQVSARVAGQVVHVDVDEEQSVVAGQPIAEVDPKDYEVALEQAEADLANAQAQYQQASVNVPITGTNVQDVGVDDEFGCAGQRGFGLAGRGSGAGRQGAGGLGQGDGAEGAN
jgi:membrane fusion protein (multidrug efflux system)